MRFQAILYFSSIYHLHICAQALMHRVVRNNTQQELFLSNLDTFLKLAP